MSCANPAGKDLVSLLPPSTLHGAHTTQQHTTHNKKKTRFQSAPETTHPTLLLSPSSASLPLPYHNLLASASHFQLPPLTHHWTCTTCHA